LAVLFKNKTNTKKSAFLFWYVMMKFL